MSVPAEQAEAIIREELKRLGLFDETIDLYLTILGRGPLTVGEISMLTKKGYEIIEKALKELESQELLRKIEGTPPRYEALPPLKLFAAGFERTLKVFSELEAAIRESLENDLSRLDEATRTALEEHLKRLREELAKSVERITGELRMKVSSIISESVERELKEMREEIDRVNKTISALYEELMRAEKAAPSDVWIVRGLKGIMAHIRDSISRAKHSVWLVLPEISQVPVEELEKLPENVRVKIVCSFDPSNPEHRKVISRLARRKFLQIRRSTRENMIFAITDERELIFAPYSKEGREIYGIATVHEDMIFALRDFLTHAWTTAEPFQL